MKLYPQDIEQKLGFDQIRTLLISFCQSRRGEELATKSQPTDNSETLSRWLSQLSEMMKLKNSSEERVSFEFPDIDDYLKRVKIPGSFLDPAGFHDLKSGINTLVSWVLLFQKKG